MVQANNLNLRYPEIKTQFLAEVEFGMPSKECKNFGICRIAPLRWEESTKDRNSLTIVTILEGKHLELDFLKSFLSQADHQKFLAKKTFLIEEDYVFVSEEKQYLNFRVLKGKYPIHEKASIITVRCKLGEKPT